MSPSATHDEATAAQRAPHSMSRFGSVAALCAVGLVTLAAVGCGSSTKSAKLPSATSQVASVPGAQDGVLLWGGAYSSDHIGLSLLAQPPTSSVLGPEGLAPTSGLAARAGYVYSAENSKPAYIGRALLSRSGPHPTLGDPQEHFIALPASGESSEGIAVDSTYIYWTSGSGIGRAHLDGSNSEPAFITHLKVPAGGNVAAEAAQGLAVEGQYLYWAGGGAIGRARIDGTEVNPTFIAEAGENNPAEIAADSEHLYWSSTQSIGRARIDGSKIEPNFLTATQPFGIAVDGGHLYWGGDGASIGRAALDGSAVEPNWIDTHGSAEGVQSVAVMTP